MTAHDDHARVRISDLRHDIGRFNDDDVDGYLLNPDAFGDALVALLDAVEAADACYADASVDNLNALRDALAHFEFAA